MAQRDPSLARNELIFPSSPCTRNCTFEPMLGDHGDQVTDAFEPALNG